MPWQQEQKRQAALSALPPPPAFPAPWAGKAPGAAAPTGLWASLPPARGPGLTLTPASSRTKRPGEGPPNHSSHLLPLRPLPGARPAQGRTRPALGNGWRPVWSLTHLLCMAPTKESPTPDASKGGQPRSQAHPEACVDSGGEAQDSPGYRRGGAQQVSEPQRHSGSFHLHLLPQIYARWAKDTARSNGKNHALLSGAQGRCGDEKAQNSSRPPGAQSRPGTATALSSQASGRSRLRRGGPPA